jgi:HEAT repeat protein
MPTANEIKDLIARMPELDLPLEPLPPGPDGKKQEDKRINPKGRLTGPPWPEAEKLYEPILAGGKDAVLAVIDLIKDNDTGPDYKPRYVLHGLALYVSRPANQRHRATLVDAISTRLPGPQSKTIRASLVRTLQTFADRSALPALTRLLDDPDLCDPAAMAMAAIGEGAAEHLGKALASATGRSRLAIIQALGTLKDASATQALLRICGDGASDSDTRLTALWALARSASPEATELMLATVVRSEDWPKTQATKAALLLAENLAAAGNKDQATKLYQHIRDTHDAPGFGHIREAAERGLAAVR